MAVQDISRVTDFLKQLKIVTVAVIDDDGKPWAVPVGVQRYDRGSLTWLSKNNTVHSRAIAKNPEVMLSAFIPRGQEGGMFGLYARARVKKSLPTPGFAPYTAELYQVWYTDNDHQKQEINIQDL